MGITNTVPSPSAVEIFQMYAYPFCGLSFAGIFKCYLLLYLLSDNAYLLLSSITTTYLPLLPFIIQVQEAEEGGVKL